MTIRKIKSGQFREMFQQLNPKTSIHPVPAENKLMVSKVQYIVSHFLFSFFTTYISSILVTLLNNIRVVNGV